MLWASTFIWIILLGICLPAVYRVMAGRALEHDILGFSFAWVAVVMLGFSARWIFAFDNMFWLETMRVAGCFLAIFLGVVSRFYKKWG